MRASLYILSIIVFGSLASCERSSSFNQELLQLDSLITEMNLVTIGFNALESDSLQLFNEQITTSIMNLDTALVIRAEGHQNILRSAKSTLLQLTQTQKELEWGRTEAAKCQLQMTQLTQAIREHATHDAQGNQMDEAYVKASFDREMGEARKLIEALPILQKNVSVLKYKSYQVNNKLKAMYDKHVVEW